VKDIALVIGIFILIIQIGEQSGINPSDAAGNQQLRNGIYKLLIIKEKNLLIN